jgi:hypothetical protein
MVSAREQTDMSAILARAKKFRDDHPEAIITYPSESASGLWELSLPGLATQAFGSLDAMVSADTSKFPQDGT